MDELELSEFQGLFEVWKSRDRVALNAKEWNLVFQIFSNGGPHKDDAIEVMWRYAIYLINLKKSHPESKFGNIIKEDYTDQVLDWFVKSVLEGGKEKIKVTYFRDMIKDKCYRWVISKHVRQTQI